MVFSARLIPMIAFSGQSNGCGFIAPYIRDIRRLMIHLRIKVNNPFSEYNASQSVLRHTAKTAGSWHVALH
jgi:hypothetical protein